MQGFYNLRELTEGGSTVEAKEKSGRDMQSSFTHVRSRVPKAFWKKCILGRGCICHCVPIGGSSSWHEGQARAEQGKKPWDS